MMGHGEGDVSKSCEIITGIGVYLMLIIGIGWPVGVVIGCWSHILTCG